MLADAAAAALLALAAHTAVLADLAAAALLAPGEPAAVFADDVLLHHCCAALSECLLKNLFL